MGEMNAYNVDDLLVVVIGDGQEDTNSGPASHGSRHRCSLDSL